MRYDDTLRLAVLDRVADPIEGGSANSYDYVAGDPINHFDLDGLCKKHKGLLGRVRDAGCHTGNVVTKNRVAHYVAHNPWKVAGWAVSGVCIVGTGGAGAAACFAAGTALLAAKSYATYRRHGGVRDYAVNILGWYTSIVPGAGAAGVEGLGGYAVRGLAESFNIACSSIRRCSGPEGGR